MAVELGSNTALFALALLIINGGLQWIRELKKGNNNGKHHKEIKRSVGMVEKKVDRLDGKIGETTVMIAEINTAVDAQKTQCAATVKRFDTAISEQNQEIIRLAGRKR